MKERETIEIEVDREDIVKALEHKEIEVNEKNINKIFKELQTELEIHLDVAISDMVYGLKKGKL